MTRASGKARRWPDVLIGLLVVLLLGGFAFLLVGQRPQPVAQAPTPATPPATEPAPEPVTIPAAPGSGATGDTGVTPPTSAGGTGDTAPAPTATLPPATDTNTGTPADAPTTTPGTDTAGAQDGGNAPAASTEIPVVPAAPIEGAPPAGATATNPAEGEPTETPSSTTPATPPRTTAPVATSEQRTPLRSDYRVSLGSFATRRTAERLTQDVRDLGYTVYPIDLGDQVVAQIGPFPDEATARRALADIQRAYPGAVLYPPRGRSLRGETAEPTPPPAPTPAAPDTNRSPAAAPTPAGPAPTSEAPAPPEATPSPAPRAPAPSTPAPPAATEPKASAPAAPSGPVYLQLGAFDQVESAQNLVAELRREGYAPTVNAPDGRKVTVLVGPFSGTALTNAETNLAAQGHDFFRVR